MEEQAANTPQRILVVDDSRLMRVAARKILKDHFEVHEAEDGEVAWEKLQSEVHFDVIMSDLSMPNLDGLGLLDKIRASQDSRIKTTPVVIVTGAEDDTAAKEQALERGADDFITKPFDSVQLVARTKAQVRLVQTTRERDEKSAALEKQSSLDPLTELLNLRAFGEAGEQDLAYAKRHVTDLGIIRLEVLNFNKTFLRHGKAVAEKMIVDVARILKAHLRKEDSAARTGMAQFGLLLPASTLQGTRTLLERVGEEITALHYDFGDASFNAGISSLESLEMREWNALLADAEKYLSEAKQSGANAIAWNQQFTAAPSTTETMAADAPQESGFDFGSTLSLEEPSPTSTTEDSPSSLETIEEAGDSLNSLPAMDELPELDLPTLDTLDLAAETTESSPEAHDLAPMQDDSESADAPLPETGSTETHGNQPVPDFAPLTLAEDTTSGALSLEEALERISANEGASLEPQLNELVRRVLPLLTLWDEKNGATLSVCINTLRHKVGAE